jgi:F-type H+-transporting ATPase subunit a
MPHGHSWFDVLLGTFYKNTENAAHVFSAPVSDDGLSWVAHEHISLQHVFAALLVLILITIVAFVTNARIKNPADAIIPDGKLTVASFVELITQATYGQLADMMGPKAARFFLPLIGTCAFFILFSNALGLVPGFLPPTDKLNTTLACASVIFFTTHIFGVKEHGLPYFKHFLGPIIKWYALPLMLLMLVIELISGLVKPASLAIRLMANMTADHMVLTIFIGLVPFFVPLPMYVLGTIVVIVQTLVFCLLSSVYISMAIAHEEH